MENKLLVFTHIGQKDLKEAYSFDVAADWTIIRRNVVITCLYPGHVPCNDLANHITALTANTV